MTPIDDARRLLALVELLYLARRSSATHGVQTAGDAAARLVPLGRRLRAAVEAAERGEQLDVAEVEAVGAAAGEDLGPADSVRGLISAALRGVRGAVDRRPG